MEGNSSCHLICDTTINVILGFSVSCSSKCTSGFWKRTGEGVGGNLLYSEVSKEKIAGLEKLRTKV